MGDIEWRIPVETQQAINIGRAAMRVDPSLWTKDYDNWLKATMLGALRRYMATEERPLVKLATIGAR